MDVKGLLGVASCVGDTKKGTSVLGGVGEDKDLSALQVDGGLLKPAMTGITCSCTESDSSERSNDGSLLKVDGACGAGDMLLAALHAGWMPSTLDAQACHQASATYLSDLQQQVQAFLGQGAQVCHASGWGVSGAFCAPGHGIDQLLKNALEYYF